MTKQEKTYMIEEVKEHGRKFIAEQANILKQNLREKRSNNEKYYV